MSSEIVVEVRPSDVSYPGCISSLHDVKIRSDSLREIYSLH